MTTTVTQDSAPTPAPTASVVDVAEYILAQQGEMSAMKLHKLVYYSQAWHLAWCGKPLFSEEIHAWANGPAIPTLYALHKGVFTLGPGFFYEKLRAQSEASMSVVGTTIEEKGGYAMRAKQKAAIAVLTTRVLRSTPPLRPQPIYPPAPST